VAGDPADFANNISLTHSHNRRYRMSDFVLSLSGIGSLAFGLVVGWITYRTLVRITPSGLNDIATVIGAVGGAAVTALFPKESGAFGAYCIGLAIGFFGYLIVAIMRPDLKPSDTYLLGPQDKQQRVVPPK
jgi:NhaP-type Na+/H+ or K+/H+ antiporter